MGMDLIARKPKTTASESIHFNWTGWRVLASVLGQLDADLRLMSGTNDGDYIPAPVCRAWSKLLKRALSEKILWSSRIQNSMYAGGYYDCITVQDNPKGVESLVPDDKLWLIEVIEFLDNCGGCRQW